MECNHEESYRKIMEYQNAEHVKNQKRIRWGIRCVIMIPMCFLILMFSMNSSKIIFLVLWIISLFTISAYLIYVEYMDYSMQERLAELGIKEDDKIDELLPSRSIDARLEELEQKIAMDRALLDHYLNETGLLANEDDNLIEEKPKKKGKIKKDKEE